LGYLCGIRLVRFWKESLGLILHLSSKIDSQPYQIGFGFFKKEKKNGVTYNLRGHNGINSSRQLAVLNPANSCR